MEKALSLMVNPAADVGGADLKRTNRATCKEAQVDTKLVAPNRTQDCLSIESPGRLRA
jgi:hypothetical protein